MRAFCSAISARSSRSRAADRLAGGAALGQQVLVDLEAQLAQRGRHPAGAAVAVGAELLQAGQQRRVGMVDAVAEHVQVVVLAVERGQLGGRHDADPAARGRRQRLVDPADRVVVAERQQLHARGGRAPHDLRGRQVAVGVHGVRLEIEVGADV